jgi:hypothetical protein
MRKGRFEVRILDPLPPLVWSHLRPNTGIPGIFPASREFGFRDGFARDCLLQRGQVRTRHPGARPRARGGRCGRRRGSRRRRAAVAAAAQPVFADDLDQQRTAPVVPRLRIGERLRQCIVEPVIRLRQNRRRSRSCRCRKPRHPQPWAAGWHRRPPGQADSSFWRHAGGDRAWQILSAAWSSGGFSRRCFCRRGFLDRTAANLSSSAAPPTSARCRSSKRSSDPST